MLLRIVSIVFPLFAIVAAGWLYGRRHKPDMALANQLNMDVFVPALVFAALAGKSFDLLGYQALALGGIAVVLGSGLAAWPLARLLRVDAKTFLPPMMFNNSGNMGLPLAVLAFGEAALPAAVVLFLVENLLHFSLGAWMLDHRARLATLWRMPMMLAALAGLAMSLSGIALWPPLVTAIRMLGDISIPLLLFALGVRLAGASFHAWGIGLAGAVARPVLGMLIAWGAGRALGLSTEHQAMLLVFGALPPAVLNYVFAERYAQEPDKVASIVMVGNVAALLFIPVALAIAF
ncbi:MAG: AEC family transporter [Rhodocyclaceae bacterium]|uniref:AEC family transporter n=1 Tax=Candidatus Desulfobacillus denitrificans TaxID=2608985 RepID=A0A809R5R7_9PROT|nr:AEC family transporter [Rhodocyclaceae bacterium]BBO22028.1 AEC family transporter [Candidatus Desulfobacillus denitrificans]